MAKRITSKDIADLAGVSRTTVSFVLNNAPGMRIPEETRQRVLDAARQLNYHPNAAARSMVRGRTMVIGLVICQYPEQVFADHFLPQALHGLAQSAATYGYRVMFEPIPPETRHDAYSRLIRERHVDGIVVSGPRFDDEELLRIHSEGAFIVLMGQLPGAGIASVDVDNVGGAALATRHLLSLGHRRVGLITNAQKVYTSSADRLEGYREALAEAGIAFDEALVRYGDFSPHSGENAILDLLNLPSPPSAIFIASDTVALGALQAIQRQGLRIPEDLAIVSFDDIPLINFVQPPLTTVRLPAYELGWSAADRLIRMIAGLEEKNDSTLILETELVIRESCGARGTQK